MRTPCPHYALAIALGPGLLFAQASAGTDKLTEAIMYASFAAKAFHCEDAAVDDPIVSAARWTEKAIQTAAQFRLDSGDRYLRAQELIRIQERELATLRRLLKLKQDIPRKIDRAVARGNLSEAERLLPQDVPPCDAVLQRVRGVLAERRSAFALLVANGDALVQSNPAAAGAKYAAALAIDRDNSVAQDKARRLRRGTSERNNNK
jgi:hypothetical protein